MRTSRLISKFFAVTFSVTALWFAKDGHAAGKVPSSEYLNELIEVSRKENLAQRTEWLRLLFYLPSWLRSDRSLIDDDSFFLADDGKTNAQAELEATLRAFFSDENRNERVHGQCRFPSRFRWLDRTLKFDRQRMKIEECKEFRKWLADTDVSGISFVFSSYYPNNPASLFGHTYLRFHRGEGKKASSTTLLDFGASYAAYPTTGNPLLYTVMGLGGGFPGRFSLTPYYLKVQEYNNAESRDLWEYSLDFTREQTEQVMLSLVEIGEHHIDYYYFDDNCALVVLALLEVGRPDIELTRHLQSWVTPSETVRVVAAQPGFVKDLYFRPSNLRTYLWRTQQLNADEIEALTKLIESNNPHLPDTSSTESQAKIYDAALEFFDFDEQLAGTKEAVKWAALRKEILMRRAALRVQALEPKIEPPPRERPEQAAPSSRAGLLYGRSNVSKSDFVHFNWRPALHDLASPMRGYSDQLEINFFDTHLRYDLKTEKVTVPQFNLLSILSTSSSLPLKPALAWRLRMASVKDMTSTSRRNFIRGGAGKAYRPVENFVLFGIPAVDIGASPSLKWHLGLGILGGVIWNVTPDFTANLQYEYAHLLGVKSEQIDKEGTFSLAWAATGLVELRAALNLRDEKTEVEAGAFYYF